MSRDTGSAPRTVRDSMGEQTVPADALWGAQTQRAIDNFGIGGRPMPAAFIRALALVKAATAAANGALGELDGIRAAAIETAALRIADGEHADQFPVDVYQTGSGTSSNMNMNEVLALLAERSAGVEVSPNDHVNLGQSSNDVVPTTLHVALLQRLAAGLRPALAELIADLDARSGELDAVVKTGRTHLMDAMPVTFGQELNAWASQFRDFESRLDDTGRRLGRLALGGTAVGTGVNAHPELAVTAVARLAQDTGLALVVDRDPFRALSSQDSACELSGQLRTGAVACMKVANDLRWMNSGPLAGLGEIELEALQPGSSIMPGKVNPVLPEAVAMAATHVMGLDASVAIAAQSGNFQLNVMLPLLVDSLLESIELLTGSFQALARSIRGLRIRSASVAGPLARNPVLVTALNPHIGYLAAARIAKRAFAEARPILDVAEEMTDLPRKELERLLDPLGLTRRR